MTPSVHEEAALKALAATDRAAALAELVRRHRARLVRHAQGIVHDDDLAHDIVQEVFIKAMREPRLFDGEFKTGAWLHRVTTNLCFNTVRDRKRRQDILEGMPQRRSAEADQVDAVLADERHHTLGAAMERLTANHRRILEERFYRDLSYTEIADVLGVRLGTVMSRLSRAKAALLALLDGQTVEGL